MVCESCCGFSTFRVKVVGRVGKETLDMFVLVVPVD
jgi:hypothetical protein